jgi:RHS repeat-associated protein
MIASEVKKCSKEKATEISGYTYNGAGAETAIEGYSESASTGFDYNNINQLESLTPSGKGEEKLQYLGSGQAKLVGLGTTTLQNSTLGITKQTIEGNASYYARTPGGTLIDERLPGSISYNPVYDAQGDVIGLLNSGGELVQTISYGPYGENAKATKIGEHGVEYSSTNDPLLFQGGYHTAGGNPGVGNVPNGLYHFGERYYDPTTARWTQREPGSENGDTAEQGSYVFAEDDPVNATDLTGRCPFDRNLNATIYFSHKYAYIQICKNGRQVGYEKVPLLRSSRLAGRRVTVDGEMAYELVEEGVKALRKTREVEEAFAPEDTE